MRVLIDGQPVSESDAAVSVFDWGLQRGFGVFEVLRSYSGRVFRLGQHLERLARSAGALHIDPPQRADLESWVSAVAESGGDCLVRVVVTGGGRDPLYEAPGRTIVLWEPVPTTPEPFSMLPMTAPWHPATAPGGFQGVKWLSYAPNMACTDIARRAGFDDALLTSVDGLVLEGPTYTVAWVTDGHLQTPSLDAGILASITRQVLIEASDMLGVPVHQACYPLSSLLEADEALALSTVKQVAAVNKVGEHDIPLGPFASKLAAAFQSIVSDEVS